MFNRISNRILDMLVALWYSGLKVVHFRPRWHLRRPATEIIVGNHFPDPVEGHIWTVRFPGNAAGDAAPTSEFFVDHVTAITGDQNGNIYVASDTGNEVRVYVPETMGAGAPLRTLSGAATKIHRPTGLALDRQGNLYVAERGGPTDQSALLKFAPGADGNVAPIAEIPSRLAVPGVPGAMNTGLDIVSGVAIDYFDGSIYVVTCPELFRAG